MLWLLLACRGGDDARTYPDALARVAEAPAEAPALCAPIRDAGLRADCVLAGAEALAVTDPDGAARLCAGLDEGVSRDECGFQVAERAGRPELCTAAGRFEDDCRLHLWSRALREIVPARARPGEVEASASAALGAYGFATDDNRPWSALYRELLARQRPLDRASCEAAPTAEQRAACWNTGIMVYNDRINVARDRKQLPCDGAPVPAILQTTPDPELEALLAARLKVDPCSSR